MDYDAAKRRTNLPKHGIDLMAMNDKSTSARSCKADVPYNPSNEGEVRAFWDTATPHSGVAELRAKRGRPPKACGEKKEQIALRVDSDVLAWFRAQGAGWQTRMNAALKAHRDARTRATRSPAS